MTKTVSILQSNYIPWVGYFDIIKRSDEFIFYDEVQYTKNDWRNRNKIKTPQGSQWLTIPVRTTDKFGQAIQDVTIPCDIWHKKHWKTIQQNYAQSKHFSVYGDFFKQLYKEAALLTHLSDVNALFISETCKALGINTPLFWSKDIPKKTHENNKTKRLLEILKEMEATTYLSGPSASSYLDVELLEQNNIRVQWMDYPHYKSYPQPHGPFLKHLSIIDLMLNQGASTASFFDL